MKLLLIFFTLSFIKDISAQNTHVGIELTGCSDADKEYMVDIDRNELFHSDFKKQALVVMLPEFADPIDFPGVYDLSVLNQVVCKQYLDLGVKLYKNGPEALDMPQNTVYLKEDIELGVKNTLICLSSRFFPPPVHIRWTRNGVDVTENSTLSQYHPNEDLTYNQFSHLPFTPQEGDVYTCTVEHKALETPDNKTWELDVGFPSVGPSVFCGVGLAVGLLGVATGTFFLIKGNKRY